MAAALEAVAGPLGALLGSLAALVSGYGWLTGFAMMTPRILFAMGERGELPRALARVHESFRTPHVAVVANSALALVLALYGSFVDAASLSVVTRLGIFALTCASLPCCGGAGPRKRRAFGSRVAPRWLPPASSFVCGCSPPAATRRSGCCC